MLAVLLLVGTVVGTLLPFAAVRAEESLSWSSNADFAMNKSSACEQTVIDGVVISGDAYTDENCEAAEEDSGITLGPDSSFLQSVVEVAAGTSYSVALKDDGSVWAWGVNSYGQLGDGSTTDRQLPVQVVGPGGVGYLGGATAISVRNNHTCAIADGQAYCWGYNYTGQLGDNSTENQSSPVAVDTSLMSGVVTDIAVGGTHTCAIADGQAYCWGNGDDARFGTFSSDASSPEAVSTSVMSGIITDISAGSDYTCAIANGQAYCWGRSSYGQTGGGSTTSAVSVQAVSTSVMSGTVTDISAGDYHACAIAGGQAYCWGKGNNGQSGDGSTTLLQTTPVAVNASVMSGIITDISAGRDHTCAMVDGSAYCWGYGNYGQLGNGSTTQQNTPAAIDGSAISGAVTDITAGGSNSCAVTDSQVYCWGQNQYGQLGYYNIGGKSTSPFPIYTAVNSTSFDSADSISAGYSHTCAIADGQAYCWGDGGNGKLGNNSTIDQSTPVAVDTSTMSGTVSAISAGNYHTCAIADGQAYCWGRGYGGQLGNNSTIDQSTPVAVDTSTMSGTVSAISAGNYHTCAIADSQVYCWGQGDYGKLGNNSLNDSTTPVAVDTSVMSGLVSNISAGGNFSCAIADGQAYCWGRGAGGSMGNGSTDDQTAPVAVDTSTMSGAVTNIVAGNHACAVAGGQAYCWGSNYAGRLGIGTTTDQTSPTAVINSTMSGTVTDISALDSHTCAVAGGQAYCWGSGAFGRVGNGSTTSTIASPQAVINSTMSGTVTAISAGRNHTCAIAGGQAYCWGSASDGQIGYFFGSYKTAPLVVLGSISFLGGYRDLGTVSGFVVDFGLGRKTQWYSVDWQTDELPANTSLSFSARTSNDNEAWSAWSDEFTQSSVGSVSGSGNIDTLPISRFIELKLTLNSADSSVSPTVNSFSLSYMNDSQTPVQNASSIAVKRSQDGASIQNEGWINTQTPYVTWQPGEDDINGSGLLGYCMYLGQDATADLTQTGGILGDSPIETGGACQYAVDTASLDLAQPGVLSQVLEDNGQPYHLLIKAIDNAGNVYGGVAEQFSFNFDSTPPSNPAFISAPSQFVATKNVILTWPTSGDQAPADSGSGVAGLQYKIGSGGTWSDTLANSGSYQTSPEVDYPLLGEGNNLVYFRTVDNAGNISTSNVTAVIRINTSSPTQPQNLAVTPETNTANSFGFSWQAPSTFVGSAAGVTYCYTVNTLPTANTCHYTEPGQTSLDADAFATQPGDNTMYVVAKDEAGNVNYATYATVDFTANTPAPGIPGNFEMADVSTKDAQIWKLALSWEEPENTGAGVARYSIHRSTDDINYSEVATASGLSYVDGSLNQVTYYYKVRACDSANNCGAFSEPLAKLPTGRYTTAPELISNVSVEVGTRQARFNWVTDRESDSRIQYGTESGVYKPGEVTISEMVKSHSVEVENLEAGMTYYYRVKWMDEDGNIGVSGELSFTTLPAPVVKDVEVIKKSLNSALIQFTSTDATRVSINYGKTDSFGGIKTINTSSSESSYIIELDGLDDGALYSYKLTTFDSEGNQYDTRQINTFTTPARPQISNLRFQPVEGEPTSTQEVSWTTNVPASSTITYGKTGTNGVDIFSSRMTTDHKSVVRGLEDDSQYFLLAQSRDADGNLAVSDRQFFRTALDTRPPKISDVLVETSVRGNGSEARGQIVVSWKTDELATSQVAYADGGGGTEYTSKTAQDGRLTTDHVVIISDLPVSRVYQLQPISEDQSRNETSGSNQSAIIGRASDSVLNIILNALNRVFGF